ncbi:MAG TPA: UDP-3-O-(3-hydroxymyristoyl)glucosamine N-acyltransferase [Tepidisphaeraceae bacterium]|nr:UDP-3-O-(3-hydroxymyristoyl)glucosamine N-acyltransferase [Tepidisphaeraceae bacterium]
MPRVALSQIASILKLPPPEREVDIEGVAFLAEAGPADLSFLGSEKYLNDFATSRAAAVLVRKGLKLPGEHAMQVLQVNDADLAVAQVLELFAPPVQDVAPGIDSSAKVAATAKVDPSCKIGPNVFVGQRAIIAPGCTLHPNVYIGDDVSVGANCQLFPNVVVRERISIGQRVIIHAGSIVGTDGFGYRWDGAKHAKIPQIGTVIIEDDVEIGSCVCIDRAKFGSTRIGRGTKIDNLVQIAHNCQIGPHCIIVGQAALAGSVKLGAGVVIAGQAAIRDHVIIGDGATVTGCAAVMNDVEPKTIVAGMPALPHKQTFREQAALRRLPELIQQVRALQEQIDRLNKPDS